MINIVRFAKNHDVDIIPLDCSGEGLSVAQYAVGFRSGAIYQSGLHSACNPLLAIEDEIGPRARYYGTDGLKGNAFRLQQNKM